MRSVLIDRQVLDGFKRRALKRHPKEYVEEVWGRLRGEEIQVFSLNTVRQQATSEDVEYEASAECGERDQNLKLLGTIHTHMYPDPAEPSRTDLKNFKEEGELLMGIMSVKKTAKRRFSSTAFYAGRKKLELLISE